MYDAVQIINQANSFVTAARRCLELRTIDSNHFELPIAPAIVCGVFAIELYFKATITLEHGTATGHDLSILFSRLSPSSQMALRNELSLGELEFMNQLDIVSHAFVDWRYIYEKNQSKFVRTTFIMQLANASKKLAEALISISPQPGDGTKDS